MFELLTNIGRLAIGFLGILGPVVFLIICLHLRDQRKSMLYAIVLTELNRPHLRGLYTVRAKIQPLWADTVVIDLWNCSREQVWQVVERLSTKVPPSVRVEVNGISGCRVRFTGEKKGILHQFCTIVRFARTDDPVGRNKGGKTRRLSPRSQVLFDELHHNIVF